MRFFSLVCLSLILTACGAGRSVLEVKRPQVATAQADAPAFKLVVIEDARHFQAKPPQANLHSLNASDVDNPALTARAYGRKRGSFGAARGDIVLPEQETVSHVVSHCVRAAFARAGAIVVEEADPRFASARPVEVKINRFWSWLRPGAWVVAVEFDAELQIKADLPGFELGRTVTSHAEMRSPLINDSRWQTVVNEGLVKLTDAVAQELSGGLSAAQPGETLATGGN